MYDPNAQTVWSQSDGLVPPQDLNYGALETVPNQDPDTGLGLWRPWECPTFPIGSTQMNIFYGNDSITFCNSAIPTTIYYF